MTDPIRLGAEPLSIEALEDVATRRRGVMVDAAARKRVAEVRAGIEALLRDDAPSTYGVNTGFGALAEVRIPAADLARLQVNLVRSHSTGVGGPFGEAITRGMMLLRANVLMLGTSGVRPVVPELLVGMLERGVHPVIPEKGSVGASGDLAPLAHLALVLIGEGRAVLDGEVLPGGVALERVGLTPIALAAKEGLSLINGTQAMTADAALTVARADRLAKLADIAGAASLQALLGSRRPFAPRIQAARRQPGQAA